MDKPTYRPDELAEAIIITTQKGELNRMKTVVLYCESCGENIEHEFTKTEPRKFSYHSKKEGCEKEASGVKDIWACKQCSTERIYGAPEESHAYTRWSMKDEKKHISEILKNFGKSRAILFCPTPNDWINQYMRGLDRRYYGFNDGILNHKEKIELKIFALEELKRAEEKQKSAKR